MNELAPQIAATTDRPAKFDARPGLAVVSNCLTPYRVNLHRLISAGIPELKLHSLITHGIGDFDFQMAVPPELNVTNISIPGENPQDNPLRRPVSELRKARQLCKYIKQNNVRAVIFNGYRYIPYLGLMAYCHRHHISFFIRSDSNIRGEPELSLVSQTMKRAIYRWWMKRASGVLSMGEFGDQFFLKYGADRKRIYRVPYWPDFDSFARADDDQLERFQRKFRLDGQRRRLLYSGRLVPQKRVDLVIDAFARLAGERPDWDLVIAGDGILGDELRGRVPDSLRHRVVWTGFLDGNEPALAYHAADLLVLPSAQEPWALVVMEAMAAGLPVVASDVVGAAREMVEDGISGRIFASGDVTNLADALRDVTLANKIDQYKMHAVSALANYRKKVDPISEIRRALNDVGILPTIRPAIEHEIEI